MHRRIARDMARRVAMTQMTRLSMIPQTYAPSPFCRDIEALAVGMRFGADDDVEERVKGKFMNCMRRNMEVLLKKLVGSLKGMKELRDRKVDMAGLLNHVWQELKAKLNVVAIAREMWTIARSKGWKMAAVAIVWELIEDVVIPSVAIYLGHPGVAAFFLAMHFEAIVYPIAFCML